MCKGLGVHELQRRQDLFCNIASFRLWNLPGACQHVFLQISKGNVLHGKEDIGPIFEPAEKLHKDRGLLELSDKKVKSANE